MSEAQRTDGGSITHDVSVPVALVPEFLNRGIAALKAAIPDCRPNPFGHFGDGNIHFNVSQPVGADKDAYLAKWDDMNAIVHGIVHQFGGSISAEHGIGQMKPSMLDYSKPPIAIEYMQRIKQFFDPNGILNPYKVIPPSSSS